MNKLFITFGLLACSNLWGTVVGCTPDQASVLRQSVVQPQIFTCGVPAGVTRNQIRVFLTGSFQNNDAPEGTQVSVRFRADSPYADPTCLATGLTNAFGQSTGACDVSDWTWTNPSHALVPLSTFLVRVTAEPGSSPLPFNASASVAYEVEGDMAPVEPVPEAGSLAMVGLGLLCFGVRKRTRG